MTTSMIEVGDLFSVLGAHGSPIRIFPGIRDNICSTR